MTIQSYRPGDEALMSATARRLLPMIADIPPGNIDPPAGVTSLPDIVASLRPGCLITTVDVANYTDLTIEAAEERLGELVLDRDLAYTTRPKGMIPCP